MANALLGTVVRHLRSLAVAADVQDLTDRQLLHRFTTLHDETAFAVLVQRHARLVWAVCRSVLRHEQDAEDALQASFLVLARKATTIRTDDALAAWLHGVAYRTAMHARRQAAIRRAHEKTGETMPTQGPEAEAHWRELLATLDAEIARLPARYRAPFVLCCLEGKSGPEAARELGRREGTVSSQLTRARQLLRQRLARRGLALPAALGALALRWDSASAATTAAIADTALRGARLLAMRNGAAQAFMASPVLLAREVLKTMSLTRIKPAVVIVMVMALVGTGLGLAAQRPAAPPPLPQNSTPAGDASPAKPGPVGPGGATLDFQGDPLPPGAVARLGTTRFRHGAAVWSVAFDARGKVLASAGNDGSIVIWEAATGREIRRVGTSHTWIKSVAVSPDGKLVVAGEGYGFHCWDVDTGKEIVFDKRLQGTGYLVAFSADGKTLATAAHGSIYLWDVRARKLIREFEGDKSPWDALAFSSDGRTLAVAGREGIIWMWDATNGSELPLLKGHEGPIDALAFSPDGKRLASGGHDRTVRLWDLDRAKEIWQGKEHESFWVESVKFSPDGTLLVSAGRDWSIRYWDPATGKQLRQWKGHAGPVVALAFTSDGKTLASGGLDSSIKLWDVARGAEVSPVESHLGRVGTAVYLADGKTVVTGGDEGLLVWEAGTGRLLRRLGERRRYSYYLAVSPDGQIVASGDHRGGKIQLWQLATGKELPPLDFGGQVFISSLAFSPDGRTLASTSYDDTIRLWDVSTGKEIRRMEAGQRFADRVAFAPDGKTLATAAAEANGDHTIRLYDVATGKERWRAELQTDAAFAIAFAPDGKTLASVGGPPGVGAETGEVRLWDTATRRELRKLGTQGEFPFALAFSPDGRTLAVAGGDRVVRLWELATGRERASFTGHRDAVMSLCFAPDGRRLVSGSGDSTGLVWDVTGVPLGKVEFSPEALRARWADLAGEDAGRAYRAVWALALAPDKALPFLRDRLRQSAAPEPRQVAQWIKDLDADGFAERNQAEQALKQLGERAEPALRKALADGVSVEARRRLERLLEGLASSPQPRQTQRAVEVLEAMGTPQARQFLRELSQGPADTLLVEEARASLERLTGRP